jgi:hypothetical protein
MLTMRGYPIENHLNVSRLVKLLQSLILDLVQIDEAGSFTARTVQAHPQIPQATSMAIPTIRTA